MADTPTTAAARFKCSGCGANLTFEAGTTQLECPYCGNVNQIEVERARVEEHDLAELEAVPATAARGLGGEGKTFKCSSCGATTSLPANAVSSECAFCGSEVVVQTPSDPDLVRPENLIPFQFDKREAAGKFRDWIRRLWFRPNNLKKAAALDEMQGVYTPYFTFDAQADSNWQGEAGHYYWEEKQYYDQTEKKHKTRRVRKTRWQWRSGRHSAFYDDVLVCASTGLGRGMARAIEPFDLSALVPYKEEFLSGWAAEEYTVDPHSASGIAQEQMCDSERRACSRELDGDTQRSLEVDTHFSQVRWKHVLLPVFIASYLYAGKRFHFLINGQTGEVHGEAPLSWWKIGGLILAIAAVGGLIYLAKSQGWLQ